MKVGPPGSLVSIDPGTRESGWAYFEDHVLRSCGLNLFAPEECRYPEHVIIELPQIYPQRRQKGDPNDLIRLAFAAGIFVSQFQTGQDYETIRPRAWKGTRPKHVCNRVTLKALADDEKHIIPKLPQTKLHNVIDAIGIGLWKLGRR